MATKRKASAKRKKVANRSAKVIFYGMKHIRYASAGRYRYTRYYVAIETPDVVVEVGLVVPDDWYKSERRIDIQEQMNKLAKRFFPKATIFMFYNRVSYRGILPPPELRPQAKATFKIAKEL